MVPCADLPLHTCAGCLVPRCAKLPNISSRPRVSRTQSVRAPNNLAELDERESMRQGAKPPPRLQRIYGFPTWLFIFRSAPLKHWMAKAPVSGDSGRLQAYIESISRLKGDCSSADLAASQKKTQVNHSNCSIPSYRQHMPLNTYSAFILPTLNSVRQCVSQVRGPGASRRPSVPGHLAHPSGEDTPHLADVTPLHGPAADFPSASHSMAAAKSSTRCIQPCALSTVHL